MFKGFYLDVYLIVMLITLLSLVKAISMLANANQQTFMNINWITTNSWHEIRHQHMHENRL